MQLVQHLPIPFEKCMCLLVEDDDDISRFEPRLLVALPGEGHLLTVLHTLVHRHLQDLPLTIHFTPVALLTPGQWWQWRRRNDDGDLPELGVNPLSLSVALAAHRLDLLHHTRPKLLDSHLNKAQVNIAAFF